MPLWLMLSGHLNLTKNISYESRNWKSSRQIISNLYQIIITYLIDLFTACFPGKTCKFYLWSIYVLRIKSSAQTVTSTTFPTSPCNLLVFLLGTHTFQRVESKEFSNRAEALLLAWGLSGDSGGMMWARLMVGFGGSGLGLRASRDGLLRVAGAGCAGQNQQRQASSADVSAAWWWCVSAGGRKCF